MRTNLHHITFTSTFSHLYKRLIHCTKEFGKLIVTIPSLPLQSLNITKARLLKNMLYVIISFWVSVTPYSLSRLHVRVVGCQVSLHLPQDTVSGEWKAYVKHLIAKHFFDVEFHLIWTKALQGSCFFIRYTWYSLHLV